MTNLEITPSGNLNFCYQDDFYEWAKAGVLNTFIRAQIKDLRNYLKGDQNLSEDKLIPLQDVLDNLFTYTAGLFEPEYTILSDLTGKSFNNVVISHINSFLNNISDLSVYQLNLLEEIVISDKKIATVQKTIAIKNINRIFTISLITKQYDNYNTNWKIRKQIFKDLGFNVDFSGHRVKVTKTNEVNTNFITNSNKVNENIVCAKMNLLKDDARRNYTGKVSQIRAAQMLTQKMHNAHGIVKYNSADETEKDHDCYSQDIFNYVLKHTRNDKDKKNIKREWQKYQSFVSLLFDGYHKQLNDEIKSKDDDYNVTPLYLSTAVKDNNESMENSSKQILDFGESNFNLLLNGLDGKVNKYNEYRSKFFAVNAMKGGHRSKDNVAGMRTLYVDFDVAKILNDKYADKFDSARLLNKNNKTTLKLVYRFIDLFKQMLVDNKMPMPSAIVMTGHGFQIYWVAKDSIIDFAGGANNRQNNLQSELKTLVRTLNYRMNIYLKNDKYFSDKIKIAKNSALTIVDPACADTARLLRVPYTFNNKHKTNKTFSYIIECADKPIDLSNITNEHKDKKYKGEFTFMDLFYTLIGKDIHVDVDDAEDPDDSHEAVTQASHEKFVNNENDYTWLGQYYNDDEGIMQINDKALQHIKYLISKTSKYLDDKELFIPASNYYTNIFSNDEVFKTIFTASPYRNCSLQNLTSEYTLKALHEHWRLKGGHQRNTALFTYAKILTHMEEFRMVFPQLDNWEFLVKHYKDNPEKYQQELRQLVDKTKKINNERNAKREEMLETINNGFYPKPLSEREASFIIYKKDYYILVKSKWSRDNLIEGIIGQTGDVSREWLIARGFSAFVPINQEQYLTLSATNKPVIDGKKIDEEISAAKSEHYWAHKSVNTVREEINNNILVVYYMNDKAKMCDMIGKLSKEYDKKITLVFKKIQVVKALSLLMKEYKDNKSMITISSLAEQMGAKLNEVRALVRQLGGIKKLKQLAQQIIEAEKEIKEQDNTELDEQSLAALYEAIYELVFVKEQSIDIIDIDWIKQKLIANARIVI